MTIYPEDTAPWDVANEELIRYAHTHVYSVHVYDGANVEIPVDVTSCQITYDSDWSPYVQGQMTIRRPDETTLARLDPKQKIRVEVYAGYTLPGRVPDSHTMANRTWLSRRRLELPGDTVTLQFQGGEYLVEGRVSDADDESPQDLNGGDGGGSWTSNTAAWVAVADVLDWCDALNLTDGSYEVLGEGTDATGWVPTSEPWFGRAGENSLGLAREVADRTELWFRCDEFGTWRLSRFDGPQDRRHILRDGADGTLITVNEEESRDDWANWITLSYRWNKVTSTAGGTKVTTSYSADGRAMVESGPYAWETVGRVALYLVRSSPASDALAGTVARNLLSRMTRRYAALTVDAVAAYWLRAGNVLSVAWSGRDPVTYAIDAVTYQLDTGRMTLRLVKPGPPEMIATG